MSTLSGEAGVLVASLDASEVFLRTLVAETFPFRAVIRIEQNATRGAQELLAALTRDRELEMPTGWSDFVEVEEAIDELLARAIVPVVQGTPAPESVSIPVVPPLPAAAAADDPAAAALDDDLPAYAAVEEPSPNGASNTYQDERPSYAYEEDSEYDDSQGSSASYYYDDDEQPAPASGGGEQQYIVYSEDDPASDAPATYEADDDLPEYLRFGSTSEPEEEDAAPAPKKVDVDEDADRWAVETGQAEAPVHGGGYRLQDLPDEDDRVIEFTQEVVDERRPVDDDQPSWAMGAGADPEVDDELEPASMADVLTSAASELYPAITVGMADADLDIADLPSEVLEDENEPTQLLTGAVRPSTAAIQLDAGGGARVLGADPEPEALEIGDAADYGEEVDDERDDATFGIGVVEYEYEEPSEIGPAPVPEAAPVPELVLPTEEELVTMLQRAATLGERDMAQGAHVYGDVLDADHERVAAYLGRGQLLLNMADYTGAISDFLRAEALAPGDPEIQAALGELYFTRKDYRRAITYCDNALELHTDHAFALHRRGMSHFYRKDYAQAQADLQKAKTLDTSLPNVDTYISLAKKKQR